MRAQRVHAEGSWSCYGHRVFGWQVETLPQRRDWRSNHAFRNIFIVDIGNVEDAKPPFAHRSVEILSSRLQIKNLRAARMMAGFFQRAMAFDVLPVAVGISDFLEVAADHRGRLVMLGHRDRLITLVAGGDENVPSHEVHEVRALEK